MISYLEPLGLTVTEVSLLLGITRKTLSFLLNEKSSISFPMTIGLSIAFENTNLEYRLNLQQQYDIWKARNTVNTSQI